MGRGNLTRDEIRTLKQNPYVEDIHGNRIVYSDEFKLLFVKEYFNGKKPMNIFRDAGFDVKVLGSKRIERASARWREANAAGGLGKKYKNNDFYERNENSRREMERTIQELREEIKTLHKEIETLKAQQEQQVM